MTRKKQGTGVAWNGCSGADCGAVLGEVQCRDETRKRDISLYSVSQYLYLYILYSVLVRDEYGERGERWGERGAREDRARGEKLEQRANILKFNVARRRRAAGEKKCGGVSGSASREIVQHTSNLRPYLPVYLVSRKIRLVRRLQLHSQPVHFIRCHLSNA